jgi:hypothetical protein
VERFTRQRGLKRDDGFRCIIDLPAFFVVLATDTGTAVTFLFTGDADLFFAVAVLLARREMDRGLRGGVLTFPSGFLLGELDLDLLVGLSGRLYLSGLIVLIRRREDAEGNGYSGFKIQIADLMGAKSPLLDNLSHVNERKTRRFLLLFFLYAERKEGREAAGGARFLT